MNARCSPQGDPKTNASPPTYLENKWERDLARDNIYIVGALCAFGIAGNVLSLVVFGHDQTIRRTTGFLLQMLAVADAAFLVSYLFSVTLYTVVKFTDWLPVASRRGSPYIAT